MERHVRFILIALVALAAGSALADPPVVATIPQPLPVPATIPEPAATVLPGSVNVAQPIANYGSLADTKLICKTEVPVGSRLGGHRVCLTKAEWEKQSRSAQDYLDTRIGSKTRVH